MSNSGQSNTGFWIFIIGLGALILYFWREVLTFILEFILGIFKLAGNIVTDIILVAIFFGAIYLISQIFKSNKK